MRGLVAEGQEAVAGRGLFDQRGERFDDRGDPLLDLAPHAQLFGGRGFAGVVGEGRAEAVAFAVQRGEAAVTVPQQRAREHRGGEQGGGDDDRRDVAAGERRAPGDVGGEQGEDGVRAGQRGGGERGERRHQRERHADHAVQAQLLHEEDLEQQQREHRERAARQQQQRAEDDHVHGDMRRDRRGARQQHELRQRQARQCRRDGANRKSERHRARVSQRAPPASSIFRCI
nr:hypothetical protein [Solirubrobacter soli]